MLASRFGVMLMSCLILVSCGGSDGEPDDDRDQHPNSVDCAPSDASAWRTVSFHSRDADNDGMRVDTAGQMCVGIALPAGYFAETTPSGSVDCDDADATRWAMLPYASRDADGDTYRVNEAGSMCVGAALPAGYSTDAISPTEADCNDSDATLWLIVGFAGRDRDVDGYPVVESGELCLGGAVALPAGYAASAEPSVLDCDDEDATRWRFISTYRDADGDGVGAGARVMACLGRNPSAGFSFKGYDPNDDADDPDAVLVSDIDLPPALMMSPEDADEDFP
jgi:hypothetical protein